MDPERIHEATVLIVESDPQERERLGSALEASGFDVIQCPGPTGPDYACVGERTGRCALLDLADVVVLDLWLSSDAVMMGTPSGELLRLYVGAGRPVVTLGIPDGATSGLPSDPVVNLGRMPKAEDLTRAVRVATRRTRREVD
jgi:hypothetical protein